MVSETRQDLIILLLVGIIFFSLSLFLSFVSPTFSSPDETANAFFAKTFAKTGQLFTFEPLNLELGDSLHPRSVISLDGHLVPVSFLGLPIFYGFLCKIFGTWSLQFWTPLFSLLAILAWYAVIRKIFNRQIALWTAFLLAFHPAWLFWTNRSLMHNVLFVSLLVFSVFFLVNRPLNFWRVKWGWGDYILAGGSLAAAVWVRTFEVFWLAFLLGFALIVFRKFISWRRLGLFFGTIILTIMPLFFLNHALYGDYFKTGYTTSSSIAGLEMPTISPVIDQKIAVVTNESSNFFVYLREKSSLVFKLLFPFGWHPRDARQHLKDYCFLMFWWLIFLAMIGLFWLFPRKSDKDLKRKEKYFFLLTVVFSLSWLGVVYGSWTVYDNPDSSAVTIGNSYVRYWLLIFLLLTVPAAAFLQKISTYPFSKTKQIVLAGLLVVLFSGFGLWSTFFSSEDALWSTRIKLSTAAFIHDQVLTLTEDEAVVVVDRGDKFFFPERQVLYPLRDEKNYLLLPKIALRVPLYYFGINLPEQDFQYLNNEKLKTLGLQIEFLKNFGDESLYHISLRP